MSKERMFTFFMSESYGIPTGDLKEGSIRATGDDGVARNIPLIRWTSALTNTDKDTANGNLFTYEEISDALADPYVTKRLDKKMFFNEFEHPTRDNPERYVMVYDSNISDRINKFWFEEVNGDKILFGDCETAIFSKGPQLRLKMISGAVPAKSLRASGNIYIDATGKERKNLTLIAYDNVFNPSDGWAWGRGDNRKDFFSETIANSKAIETFKSFDAKVASSMFSEIKHDMKLIAEASNDFKPSKIMMIKDSKQADALIGYYSESALVIAKPSIKLVKDLNSFLSI